MLERLVGGNNQIVIEPVSPSCRIRADRGQMEQVLMNLVVNARDAMPDGGTITIRAEMVRIGDGTVKVVDAYSTGPTGPHPADTDQGGSDDIISFGGKESDGKTVIEFVRKLDTGDDKDDETRIAEYCKAHDLDANNPSHYSKAAVATMNYERPPSREVRMAQDDGGDE